MDFLVSLTYFRAELYFFLWNLAFVIIYFFLEGTVSIKNLYKKLFPEGRKISKEIPLSVANPKKTTLLTSLDASVPVSDTVEPAVEEGAVLSPEKQIILSELIKHIRTKMARGEFTEARTKIIEWLALDKWHKDLNCLLASLYERDNDYRKAEFIYKDLILVHDMDSEIYMKLGFALSIQGKFEIAYEIYKKLFDLKTTSQVEASEMLAHIAHELSRHEEAIEYAKVFLRSSPKNVDILSILSASLVSLDRKTEALEVFEKLKTIDPYNPRIREMKEKVELELELAGKFVPPPSKE